jgi:hypothetical protein
MLMCDACSCVCLSVLRQVPMHEVQHCDRANKSFMLGIYTTHEYINTCIHARAHRMKLLVVNGNKELSRPDSSRSKAKEPLAMCPSHHEFADFPLK